MRPIRAHLPLLFFALGTTIFVALIYGYLYWSIDDSLTKASTAREVASGVERSKTEAQDTALLFAETENDRDSLPSFFIGSDEAVTFIESLESLGNKSGGKVTISAVSADDTSALSVGSFAHMSAHIDVSGSWSDVMRTLELSEDLPYQSSIGNVTLGMNGSGDGKKIINRESRRVGK